MAGKVMCVEIGGRSSRGEDRAIVTALAKILLGDDRTPVTAAICVPWRSGSPERERNHEFVKSWYEPLGLPFFEADADPSMGFNRGASRNSAIEAAVGHDVFLVIDGDCVCDLDTVRRGIDVARETDKLVICHDSFWRLSEKGTTQLISDPDTYRQNPNAVVRLTGETRLQGSMMPSGGLVISRLAFSRVGGWPSIPLWGFEDSVLLIKAQESIGVERLAGYMWHLHHPRSTGTIDDRTLGREIAERHLAEWRASRV